MVVIYDRKHANLPLQLQTIRLIL